MTEKIELLGSEILSLNLSEAAELRKFLLDKLGIDGSMMVGMGAAGAPPAQAEGDDSDSSVTELDLVITKFATDKKVQVIKACRTLLKHVHGPDSKEAELKFAKEKTESLPIEFKKLDHEVAKKHLEEFKNLGCDCETK